MRNVFLYHLDDPAQPGNRIAGSKFRVRTVDPAVAKGVQDAMSAFRNHEVWSVDFPSAFGVGAMILVAYFLRNFLLSLAPEYPSFLLFLGLSLLLSILFLAVARPLLRKRARKSAKNRELAQLCAEAFDARKASLCVPGDALPVSVYFLPAKAKGKKRVAGDVKYDFFAVDGYLFREGGRFGLALTREVLTFDAAAFREVSVRKGTRFVYDRADGVPHASVNAEMLFSEQRKNRKIQDFVCLSLNAEGEDWAIFMPRSVGASVAEFLSVPFAETEVE